MKALNISSLLILLTSGSMAVIAFFQPWVILHEISLIGGSTRIFPFLGNQLLQECHWLIDSPRYVVILVPLGGLLCIITSFLTLNERRITTRGALSLLYAFTAFLPLLDVHFYSIYLNTEVGQWEVMWRLTVDKGFFLSLASVVGMIVGASTALATDRSWTKSLSDLATYTFLGTLVEVLFFYVNWFRSSYSSLTGFEAAYQPSGLFNVLLSYRMPYYLYPLVPMLVYIVPILGILVIISPFSGFNIKTRRLLRVFSGCALIVISLFLITSNDRAEGIWLILSLSVVLVILELLRYMLAKRFSK